MPNDNDPILCEYDLKACLMKVPNLQTHWTEHLVTFRGNGVETDITRPTLPSLKPSTDLWCVTKPLPITYGQLKLLSQALGFPLS